MVEKLRTDRVADELRTNFSNYLHSEDCNVDEVLASAYALWVNPLAPSSQRFLAHATLVAVTTCLQSRRELDSLES